MKFTATLLLAALPLLSEVALAVPSESTVLVARQRQRGGNAAAAAAAARRQRGGRNRNGGNGGAAAGGAAAGGAAAGGAAAGGAAAGGATAVSSSAAPVATGQGQGQGQGNNAGNGAAAGNGGNNNAGNGGAAGGNNGGNNGDPQESLQLNPAVICKGFEQDGQAVPVAGQVSSLTSKNNFINHCLQFLPNTPLTDGKQIQGGSCNPAPIGVIPNVDNQPSAKFIFPQNTGQVKSDTPFTVQMAIKGLLTGNFVNANTNYFGAPQQLKGGQIVGHTHVVIQKMQSITDTTPLDPKVFQFFKGVNGAAVNGVVTADVPAPGLPAGVYRMCSINTSANHTPAIGPVAQHGSFDDCTYFTADPAGPTAAGQQGGNAGGNAGAGNAGGNAGAGNAGGNAGNNAGAGAAAGAGGAAAGGAAAGGAAAGNNGGRRGGQRGQGRNRNN